MRTILGVTVLLVNLFTESLEEDFKCDFVPLADKLEDKLFPETQFNPRDYRVLPPLPGSTCEIRLIMPNTYTITGNDCNSMPDNNSVPYIDLAVSNTGIEIISENAFETWPDIQTLQITLNIKLTDIVPGAFRDLTQLWNLSISDNVNLSSLHPKSFEGLINLQELRLLRNNIVKISDVSRALDPNLLPNVTYLDISGNSISTVGAEDFYPMNNSKLNTLVMTITKTMYIDKTAFNPLNRLYEFRLGQNNINTSVSSDLINTLKEVDPLLKAVSLQANLMFNNPQLVFNAVANSNITNLDIKNNHFGAIGPGFFPIMPNLELLDLENVMIDGFPNGVINKTIMPNLQKLFLGGNNFPGITPAMAVSTLEELNLSDNTKDLNWDTEFKVPLGIFAKMPFLQILDLTGNKLSFLRRGTFSNVTSLRILYLRDTSLHQLEDFIFDYNYKLFYLDLSNNDFPIVYPFTKNIFRGLSQLRALDLSSCSISNFQNPDVFYYLKNLQFLSLRQNSLIVVNGVFDTIRCLRKVDLRSNSIVPWNSQIFENNPNLTRVMLDNNQISTITVSMLKDFRTSESVTMYEDPLYCNCDLINSVRQYLDGDTTLNIPLNGSMNKCFSPTRTHSDVSNYIEYYVKSNACRTMPVWLIVVYSLLGITMVSIIIFGIWYQWRYELKYWYYIAKEKTGLMNFPGMKKRKLEEPNDYKYDAFVSYSHEDKKFVMKMVTILEGEFNFRLCVFHRDFNIGDLISESVMESVAQSRMTIMVLTDAFAKSQWCLWELHIAQQRAHFFRRADPDSLVIIKLADIDEDLMTNTLKHLMKTRIYLKWDSNIRIQKIFWHQLKAAIARK